MKSHHSFVVPVVGKPPDVIPLNAPVVPNMPPIPPPPPQLSTPMAPPLGLPPPPPPPPPVSLAPPGKSVTEIINEVGVILLCIRAKP